MMGIIIYYGNSIYIALILKAAVSTMKSKKSFADSVAVDGERI